VKNLLFIVLFALAGCVSTGMKKLVGQPIEEAMIAYGQPENVIEFPDGRRAYQYRWGGGSFVQPGTGTATVTNTGNVAVVTTTSTPAMVLNSPGCLITFIAVKRGSGFVITDYRVPKQLVC
jgi:hypothetical protein